MTQIPVAAFDTTIHKTHEWLNELIELGSFEDQPQAYSAFRAVIHSLRDRLTVEEATHLGAELPMLVRGFYYEGWKPAAAPNKERSRDAFLDSVSESLRANKTIGPERAITSTFQLLNRRISEGELADIKQAMPTEIKDMWDGQ